MVFPPRKALPLLPCSASGFSLNLPWTVLSSLTDFCATPHGTERGAQRGRECLSLLWLTYMSETKNAQVRGVPSTLVPAALWSPPRACEAHSSL